MILFAILSFACYRVTRLVIADTIWDATRLKLHLWLQQRKLKRKLWADKLLELIQCPFCVSVWVAFGMVAVALLLDYSIPLPVFSALAIAAAATVIWSIVEDDE